ncbi:hypothetical protein D3C86_1967770 [compost metagenome]
MAGVALDRGDQVRDQVRAALVLVDDFAPRRLDRFVLRLEIVVAAGAEQAGEDGHGQPAAQGGGRGQDEQGWEGGAH